MIKGDFREMVVVMVGISGKIVSDTKNWDRYKAVQCDLTDSQHEKPKVNPKGFSLKQLALDEILYPDLPVAPYTMSNGAPVFEP